MCSNERIRFFPAHALSAVSACGGLCKLMPYLLIIAALEVAQVVSDPLLVRSGHRTPALSLS